MDPIFLKVLIGTTLLASSAAVVGAFSYLKGQSLVGDAIAHALLPGVVLAFLLGDGRNPIFLIVGALISGLIAHYGIGYIQSRTKLKSDTAVSWVHLDLIFRQLSYVTPNQITGNSVNCHNMIMRCGNKEIAIIDDRW